MRKFGIWKIRYTQNVAAIFEDWVRQNGKPVLFSTEYAALEFMHSEDMKHNDGYTEFEVRETEVPA